MICILFFKAEKVNQMTVGSLKVAINALHMTPVLTLVNSHEIPVELSYGCWIMNGTYAKQVNIAYTSAVSAAALSKDGWGLLSEQLIFLSQTESLRNM